MSGREQVQDVSVRTKGFEPDIGESLELRCAPGKRRIGGFDGVNFSTLLSEEDIELQRWLQRLL